MKKKNKKAIAKTKNTALHAGVSLTGFGAASLLLGAALCHPSNVSALGFRIPNQDAEAIGRGNAFTATADNPSAIYYNPAGITQLDGDNAQFGFHAITINSFYNSPTGGSSESKFALQAAPQLYCTYHVDGLKNAAGESPITLGLGVYAPYGLALMWPTGSPFRPAGSSPSTFQGELTYVTLNPTLAYKLSDQLSLAIGPTFNYSQVLLREGVGGGQEFKFRGNDTAFGFAGGILYQPCEMFSFGASYHSATSMNYKGSASTYSQTINSASAELPFGMFCSGGISFRPNKKLNIEADVDWTNWRALKSSTFINTPFGDVSQRFDWHDSVMLEIGATYYLDNGYYASLGYFYSEKSTTDYNFIPVVPDTDLHVGSLGFGHKGDKWAWAVAAQIITGPDRNISNDVNPGVDGRYQWVNASFNFSIARHF